MGIELQDDVLSAVSSDMGRRKLPSIPTQRAEKASDAPSAPIYLTSSAPSTAYQPQPQPQQQIHFTQDPRAYSRPSSRTASLTDLSRPSSSASSVISYRTVDPAIIPGATISSDVRPKPPKRQTTSAATGGRPSPILTQASSSRMPSTLARVLLKKELKEVLERRRETLEACEIEANQRQYVVHRMLITGLLPEYRSSDIDDIPNVIPCLLPIELIDGARVIPDFRTATAVPSSSKPLSNANVSATIPQEHISRPPSAQSSTQEIGVSTEDFPFEPRSKSVGCQAESSQTTSKLYSPTCPPSSSTSYRMPSTSLRLQMEHDRYSSSSRLKSVETQTNGLSAHDQRRTKALSPHVSSSRRQKNHIASTSDPNLLESTAKYFAEYDRQLREHGRRMKNRFAFSDDDPVSRESKKLKLLDELAQRKEKISSMTDLTQSELFPTIHPSSDYASTVPHYGSLPHIDYPTTASTSRASRSRLRDFTYRDPMGREPYGYGSLPRNYERYLDMYGYDTTGDADFVYPPNISTRQYDALSRSLRDLNLSADDNIIDPRLRPFRTASTSYLDRHSDLMQPGRCQPYYGSSYPQNVRPQRFAGPQSLPNSDIISQYANYLSNQFMADQQQQQQQMLPTYSAPLSYQPTDTHQSYIQQGQQRSTVQQPSYEYAVGENYNTNIPSYQYPDQSMLQTAQQQQDYRYSSMPSSSMLPPSATYAYQQQQQRQQYLPSSVSQVYSRNEDNYGSRPTAYATEYGNFHRNPALAAATNVDPLGDYSNRNYLRAQQYPNMQSAYGSSLADAQYRAGGGVGMGGIHLTTPNRYLTDPSTLTQQLPSAGASGIVDPYRNYASGLPQQQRYGRAWANGNLMTSNYDAVYPKEDALSRMYATAAYPARSSRISQQQQQSGNIIDSHSQHPQPIKFFQAKLNRLPNGTQSARCSDDSDGSGALRRSLSRPRASNIKRILLTRKYHDSNVYNDVGIRVTGGKRLPNGELGAFISTVNRAKARETLGEVKEGDQVLEWNGVLLTGKTFEEVERVIAASKGEIEIIISRFTFSFYDSLAALIKKAIFNFRCLGYVYDISLNDALCALHFD
ncbi:unnamed protein product, partial [Anisakis simplex]|uniref:Protein bassoon (inferred by orthology to a human protein) n=1 Tax=Anisakis simplex TaxID=6269 RepID=A0A0M3JYE5_ANISI